METNYLVKCPYCWEEIWMEFFVEDGAHQQTVVDCEVCCNPVLYFVTFEGSGQGEASDGAAQVTVQKAQ